MDADRIWDDAVACVQADLDGEAVAEAHELYLAEAARTRLAERIGRVQVSLRSGRDVRGTVVDEPQVAGHLALRGVDGACALVAEHAIRSMTGSAIRLRREDVAHSAARGLPARSLASWLREVWQADAAVQVIDLAGESHAGRVVFVGADHLEITARDESIVLPFAAVDLWRVPSVGT